MMEIRWRRQEILFASVSLVFITVELAFDGIGQTSIRSDEFKLLFEKRGLTYSFIRDYFLPRLAPFVACYLVILTANLFPFHLPKFQKANTAWIPVVFGIVGYAFLTLIFAIAFRFEWMTMSWSTEVDLVIRSYRYALRAAGMFMLLYFLYLLLRSLVTKAVSRNDEGKQFRILLLNRVIATIFFYAAGFELLKALGLLRTDFLAIIYVFILVPIIISVLINTYGIFPYVHRKSIPFRRYWWQLFVAPLFLALIGFTFFILGGGRATFTIGIAFWLLIVLISAPVSWLLFTQQRAQLDSIAALTGQLGKTTADLQFLRSQINPHFLYNVLNTLYGSALKENAQHTADGIQRLGDMMRFMLHENLKDSIPLSREIEYLNNYIEIQKTRVGNSLINISWSLNTKNCDHNIAPMLLIPYVENAFKHGTSTVDKSWINIKLDCTSTELLFAVENSVHARVINNEPDLKESIGLENVKQRLQFIYPGKHTLDILSTETKYHIKLNIQF
ncbi:MAG: histidine kinase [Chitinophagaceae bacterium]|nr:histidine kinase [Chitinophagaceae bacterium]